MVLIRSLLLSAKHGPPPIRTLPIVAAWGARLQRARGARLELGGRLVLDYQAALAGRRWFGELPVGRTIVRLTDRTSLLRTTGPVSLAGGVQIVVGPGATLSIGGGTYVNPNARILCASAISIGAGCAISWGVSMMDFVGGHELTVAGVVRPDSEPITLGDHVLVGARATILKGLTIGSGAVVAAAAVVTRDVPPRALVAGIPARVVAEDVDWKHSFSSAGAPVEA
jgi:acetyltransferase-like isoleucine patch superfamily enzyme